MPFNRPTLRQLVKRTVNDVVKATNKTRALLRYSPEGAIATALGGVSHGLHGHIVWALRQMVPSPSTELAYLRRWTRILADMDAKESDTASGSVTATGVDLTTTPAGHIWQRLGDGAEYSQVAAATIENGQMVFDVVSVDAGEAFNVDAGETLESGSVVIGLDPEATVGDAGLTGGTEDETGTDLYARLEDHLQAPRAGGTIAEYRDWALEIGSVSAATPIPKYYDPGSVLIIIDTSSGQASAALVEEVRLHIVEERPAVDDVYVEAAKHVLLPFSIVLEYSEGIETEEQKAEVRVAVEAELDDMLARDGQLADSAGDVTTINRSRISDAISNAAGEHAHVLVHPAVDPVYQVGEVPDRGAIVWG